MRGCATLALGFMAAAATVACIRPPRDRPIDEVLALAIAGKVFGFNAVREIGAIGYMPATCEDQYSYMPGFGQRGYKTAKGNCTTGGMVAYTSGVNIAWWPGAKYSDTGGLCKGVYQQWERITFGLPDVYNQTERWKSGEASRLILLCQERQRAAGLRRAPPRRSRRRACRRPTRRSV